EVSFNDNEVTEVKALMTLADEERVSIGKESARNGEWIKIFMKKVSITGSNKPNLSETEDSTLSNHDSGKHPLLPQEKLTGAKPVSGPKTIKSILKSNSTFKAKTLKGIIINEPSSAPARGNKSSLASKTNSTLAGKLKNVKMEDDPPLAILMKELNELKLQISRNKSSYFRNKNSQQVNLPQDPDLQGQQYLFLHAYIVDIMIINLMIVYTIPYVKYVDAMIMILMVITIISLRRGIKPRNPQHVTKNYETCGSNVHTTYDHNDIKWFMKREALQAKKAVSFKASKTESSSALRLKTPTKSFALKGNSDSDCAGCNMDRKSTSAEAEDVVAAGCCADIL
ncbi:hypothetical protein Tco_0865079, partial [Tanacetum coccineum]